MKLFPRATASGATLSGATQKAVNLGVWDALKTAGLSPNNRAAITATATLTTDQCGLVLVDASAGSMVLTLPVSGSDTDDAWFMFRRIDATANTVTIRRNGTDTIEGSSADQFVPVAGAVLEVQMPAGAINWRIVTLTGSTQAGARAMLGFPLRGFIGGLTLSTAGSSATFAVAAGEAADTANAVLLQLAATISKTTSAWAVGSGNGGLDTGAIAINTWYHAYLIRRPDTGVVDVLVSLSATAPTMPASYTQSRRIGAMRTNTSSQWTKFVQDGDFFLWDSPVQDVSAVSAGTAAVLRTLSVPSGVSVRAHLSIGGAAGASGDFVYLSDPATSDVVPGASNASIIIQPSSNTAGMGSARTNTSAQVRSRQVTGGATETLRLNTLGWFDTRGKDA